MKRLEPHEPGWELWLYRCRRRGYTLTAAENDHLDTLESWYPRFEQMAEQHDEQDKLKREEIAHYPHGYGWYKGPGGGLPFDWADSELAQLRPRDWTLIRHIRFYPSTRRALAPRRPRPRGHVRRPSARRRSSSSSRTASSDPGESEPPAAPPRLALVAKPGAILTYAVLTATERGEAVR